jgi:F420-dependent oxidoreductase-like protein
VDFRIFVEPQQGATYADQLAVARAAESAGYSAFFRSDHYVAMSGDGLPGPTDSWVTLGGIARETSTIRLGTMVTSATFRHPGPLAIAVAQVDEMSGGRVELGLGAGWYEAEHTAYGIPFPSLGERFDRLEEQLAVITGLWASDGTFSHDGAHYRVADSPGLPKPHQDRPPVIVGGTGKRRTPVLAAAYADETNVPFSDVATTRAMVERVSRACEARDRDPATMRWSNALTVCLGADEAEVRRRAEAIGRDVDELRTHGVAGTPREAAETLARYAEAGSQRVYLQVLDLADLDHLDLIADALAPAAASLPGPG